MSKMSIEQKNQLISHLPIIMIPVFLFISLILPKNLMIYGFYLTFNFFIIQGIIYIFKKRIYFRFGYIGKITKIISGMIFICLGISADICFSITYFNN